MSLWHREPQLTLGQTGSFLWPRRVALPLSAAQTHIHLIGVSGAGKSGLLALLARALMRAGCSLTLFDPHGELARDLLGLLVQEGRYRDAQAFERIVYLDLPAAEARGLALPLNLLKQPGSARTLGANILNALQRYWPALAGGVAPRFDKLVQYGVKLLVSNELPLPALPRLLLDRGFREELLAHEPDDDIVAFWRRWYAPLAQRPTRLLDYIDSTHSRLDLLSYNDFLRQSLGHPDLSLDLRQLMDAGRTVLVNLALADREAGRLLGCLLTVLAEQAALSRSRLARNERRPHYLVLDECASVIERSPAALNTLLAQALKYQIFAVLAHQTWSQIPTPLQGALQNCGVQLAFTLDYPDALQTSRSIGRVVPRALRAQLDAATAESVGLPEQWQELVQQLQDLPPRHFFLKRRGAPLVRGRTLELPREVVPAAELAAVEQEYLRRCFVPVASAVAGPAGPASRRREVCWREPLAEQDGARG